MSKLKLATSSGTCTRVPGWREGWTGGTSGYCLFATNNAMQASFLIFIYYPNIVVKILGQPVGLFYRSSSVNMANWCIVLHSNSKSPTAPIDSTAKAHQNKEVKKDGYIFLRHFIGSQKKTNLSIALSYCINGQCKFDSL
jgi:hypothetical protein